MKFKAVVTNSAPTRVIDALYTDKLTAALLSILGEHLGVKDVFNKPAQFYVQKPDITLPSGMSTDGRCWGVELRLTGASRQGRRSLQFRMAAAAIHAVIKKTIEESATTTQKLELFVAIMLDGDIEVEDGVYGNLLETEPEWIHGKLAA